MYDISEQDAKKDIPDHFADQFSVTIHPYGATFSWMKTRVVPMGTVVPEGQSIPPEVVSITRMAPAHVKMMIFTLFRLIREQEEQQKCSVPIPQSTLDDMKITAEQWAAFWPPIVEGETPNEIAPVPAPVAEVPAPAPAAAPAVFGSQPPPA